jgi:hypothetical protein
MDVTLTGTPAVAGLADSRSTTLDRLAEAVAESHAVAESLKHVIPAVEAERVAVAAFASSI